MPPAAETGYPAVENPVVTHQRIQLANSQSRRNVPDRRRGNTLDKREKYPAAAGELKRKIGRPVRLIVKRSGELTAQTCGFAAQQAKFINP
jgi:hypothetical protein